MHGIMVQAKLASSFPKPTVPPTQRAPVAFVFVFWLRKFCCFRSWLFEKELKQIWIISRLNLGGIFLIRFPSIFPRFLGQQKFQGPVAECSKEWPYISQFDEKHRIYKLFCVVLVLLTMLSHFTLSYFKFFEAERVPKLQKGTSFRDRNHFVCHLPSAGVKKLQFQFPRLGKIADETLAKEVSQFMHHLD